MIRNSRIVRRLTKRALSKVAEVNAHVHRVSFSAPGDVDQQLFRIFGEKAHKVEQDIGSGWYRCKAVIHSYYGRLVLFYGQPFAPMPNVVIQTADTSPRLMRFIGNVAPDILVSSAEFAVDLVVRDPESVADLFYAIRRNAYFPRWRGEILLLGDSFSGWGDVPQLNRVYKVRPVSGSRAIKAYERGPDRLRRKAVDGTPFWFREHLDRVRIEVTLGRTDMIDGKRVLGGVNDFLATPKIRDVIARNVHFKRFEGSRLLPGEFGSYKALDDSGYDQCFQAEYREAKELVQNPSQYLREASCMTGFRQRLLVAAETADWEWREGVAEPVE